MSSQFRNAWLGLLQEVPTIKSLVGTGGTPLLCASTRRSKDLDVFRAAKRVRILARQVEHGSVLSMFDQAHALAAECLLPAGPLGSD